MNAVLSADLNWGIGNKGGLLMRIPDDMRLFRQRTTGNVIIMGRKTLESFPGGRALTDRVNIVLTKDPDYRCADTVICHSVEETFRTVKQYYGKEIYIIGGSKIYRQFLPYCDTAYVTKIFRAFEADSFVENLDEDSHWKLTEESPIYTYKDVEYQFVTYKRVGE